MRITKEELRRVIRETVKRKLEEADLNEVIPDGGPKWMADERAATSESIGGMVDAVAGALVTQVIERLDHDFNSSAYEQVMGLGQDDTMMRPGRYEDVEHFAAQAVDKALSDPELKDALLTAAMEVIKGLMEPG